MSGPHDIAAWLGQIGLPEYAPIFAQHAIDSEVLADLADQDLRELGVPLGHRKRLLKAIAALREPVKETAGREEAGVPGALPREAERRQLTVMFVDLVGSTELAARLDPEDMSAVIRAYQNTVAGEITRFEGHIAKYMGDGVLAYFGWPRAHEDDAERAVRAGLAIAAAVPTLVTPAGGALAARVGVATGLVVVGDLIGEGGAREEAVVGETPNLAARLQALAEPGAVVLAEATRRLVGGLFDFEDLGPRGLKGIDAPVRAFAVARARAVEDRFEARQAGAPLPLVGRDPELALLLDRWRLAMAASARWSYSAGSRA
jgi:class 3 adenylate cyclase